ncbi:hypothetical protein ACHAWU_003038 [Discostella pseudostelligera]|uniref:NADP-dependent oxidoreductase domain-containing protein n=1 Tax=Discostella pseudostelligera TaxID=259834 RepID=A0ABD3M5P3_9STRA
MKRPRATPLTLISLIAIASSPLHLTVAASLRAIRGPAVDDGGGGGSGGDTVVGDDHSDNMAIHSHLPLHPSSPGEMSSSLPLVKSKTVRLATSRGTSTSLGHSAIGTRTTAPEIPLIGIGVGNLPHTKIPYILASALDTKNRKISQSGGSTEELNYRLVDSSHATDSALEVLVGRSLSRLSSLPMGDHGDDDHVYHVMIKIWHTHLGYERTMLSVQNSLSDILPGGGIGSSSKSSQAHGVNKSKSDANANKQFTVGGGRSNVRIHAIMQHPRCYDELFTSSTYLTSPNIPIKYQSCREEEDALDTTVKSISNGHTPLFDKDNAWKRSYRALEELYHHGTIESIGVSNFDLSDMSQLFNIATVGPHIYQGSLHTLMTQEDLVEELVQHGVHYQCYDAVSTILKGREDAPHAYSILERIGAKHGYESGGGTTDVTYGYSPIQVVLGYLVHHRGVGVIPGTTDISHLAENSPSSLESMPQFSPRQLFDIEMAIQALLNKDDRIVESENNNHAMGDSSATSEDNVVITGTGFTHGATGNSELSPNGDGMVATFFNTLPHPRSVRIFQIHPETGEQIQLLHGRSGRLIVNVDDVLIAYDAYGVAVQKFLVEEDSGQEKMNGHVDFIVKSL